MILRTRRVLSVATLVGLCLAANGAIASQRTAPGAFTAPRGMVQDWSTQHVLYPNPDTPEEAARKGRTAAWQRSYRDPRFVLALTRKLEAQAASRERPITRSQPAGQLSPARKPKPTASGIHRDWSTVLGGGTDGLGGVGVANVYPAKFSFDINAAPDCANDYVVYPTATAGRTDPAVAVETRTSVFGGVGLSTGSVTIGTAGTARSVVLTASSTTNTGLNFQTTGGTAAEATNLRDAVNRWSGTTGITATSSGPNVVFAHIMSGNTVDIPITETISNYTVGAATDGGAGTPGQPTIVAFNQLYNTTCASQTTPGFPNVYWSYNTGTGRIAETSPVISYYDGGKQIAFVQRNTAPNPDTLELVLLKWKSGDGTAGVPAVPLTASSASDYRNPAGVAGGCSASSACMIFIPFNESSLTSDSTSRATASSPFVDYANDILWVGDADGNLRKFTGVFAGSPAVVNGGGSGFPAIATQGFVRVSSPVIDFSTGNIFLGSMGDSGTDSGKLFRMTTAGGRTRSAQVTPIAGGGVAGAPMVDGGNGDAFVFVADDNNTAATTTVGTCTTAPCHAIYRFPTTFGEGGGPDKKVLVGSGNVAAKVMYDGTFDKAYYGSRVGNLYVCGGSPTDATLMTLWKIPVNNGVFGTPVQGPGLTTTGAGDCSPISEIFNTNANSEYIYVSVPDHNATAGGNCIVNTGVTGGCLSVFKLTGLTWNTSAAPAGQLQAIGGTGGVVLDNISATAGASQVYFSNLSAPGNAYQASQSVLQ